MHGKQSSISCSSSSSWRYESGCTAVWLWNTIKTHYNFFLLFGCCYWWCDANGGQTKNKRELSICLHIVSMGILHTIHLNAKVYLFIEPNTRRCTHQISNLQPTPSTPTLISDTFFLSGLNINYHHFENMALCSFPRAFYSHRVTFFGSHGCCVLTLIERIFLDGINYH